MCIRQRFPDRHLTGKNVLLIFQVLCFAFTDSLSHYTIGGKIIKNKYTQKYPSKAVPILVKCINYFNKTPFVINQEVLNYLIKQWETNNSVIFGNYNHTIQIQPGVL